jgi:hypothetical protein
MTALRCPLCGPPPNAGPYARFPRIIDGDYEE